MRNHFVMFITFICVMGLTYCTLPEKKTNSILKFESSQFSKERCVDKANQVCASFNISYPIFSGGDSLTVLALNKSVHDYILSALGGNDQLPFAQALDSASWAFFLMFQEAKQAMPKTDLMYTTEISDTVPFISSKVVTVQMDGYSFTGGAHPNPFSSLVSYDLTQRAKPLQITDLISDTNAVRPALEKAFKQAKGLQENEPINNLIYSEIPQLPMPTNVAVAAEGIRFFYNTYEVAPYVVGACDVLLTWDQLGALADRNKWIPL